MAVVAGGAAGGAHLCDVLALVDGAARLYQHAGAVGVIGLVAVGVVDLHHVAVAALPAGVGDLAAVGGNDVGTAAVGDPEKGIEADNCVTIRDRDTMEQIRMPISEVKDWLMKKMEY